MCVGVLFVVDEVGACSLKEVGMATAVLNFDCQRASPACWWCRSDSSLHAKLIVVLDAVA